MTKTELEYEDRLVLMAQAGDRDAFDLLLKRYEVPLFRHIHRLLGEEEAAYDALQETYMAIVRSIRKLRSRAKFRAWSYGVATRVCLKARSKSRHRRKILSPYEDSDTRDSSMLPESLVEAREKAELSIAQVRTLSPRLRAVILLHFFEELTLTEVAAALELPLGTIKSRLAAGLVQLRKLARGELR